MANTSDNRASEVGVVHANVGQKVLNRNIFSNFTYFLLCPATEICTPLLADATDSVIN